MKKFVLDSRLANDCIVIDELELSFLLLMNNALVPWFILVPKVDKKEIIELSQIQQKLLQQETNLVSNFIQNSYTIDKLNTATIGNIVEQLHIHIIGRNKQDYCWPNVVWGQAEKQFYTQEQIEQIKQSWQAYVD